MRDSQKPSAAPFTVIELLTTIALLGILIAIALPMISSGKHASPHPASASSPATKP